MTVGELIQALQKYPSDLPVWLDVEYAWGELREVESHYEWIEADGTIKTARYVENLPKSVSFRVIAVVLGQ